MRDYIDKWYELCPYSNMSITDLVSHYLITVNWYCRGREFRYQEIISVDNLDDIQHIVERLIDRYTDSVKSRKFSFDENSVTICNVELNDK